MESDGFLFHLHQSHRMLWAAVLVWHSLIQSSLMKHPARTWKETAATYYKWAAPTHCQHCHREGNGMGFGLELITFPFPPCMGKRWSDHLGCSPNLGTTPLQAVFSCSLQPEVAIAAHGCQHGPSSSMCTPPNQHSAALEESRAPMGTGILITIPCIAGEAFIWRFQRISSFPALRITHKQYHRHAG